MQVGTVIGLYAFIKFKENPVSSPSLYQNTKDNELMEGKGLLWLPVVVCNWVMLMLWTSGNTGAGEKWRGVLQFPFRACLQRPKGIPQGQTMSMYFCLDKGMLFRFVQCQKMLISHGSGCGKNSINYFVF